jgi:hypothetical protein
MENIIIKRKNLRGSSAPALPEKNPEAAAILPMLSRRKKAIPTHTSDFESHRDETKGRSQ